MRFSFISDTHGLHQHVKLRGGDILFHSGDISLRGKKSDMLSFFDWFSKQDYQYRVFIVGNHDIPFDASVSSPEDRQEVLEMIPDNIIYLENSGVDLDGLKVWGSPCTPRFNNHAFNVDRGEAIASYWSQIPLDTDVLLTHGPAHSILDTNFLDEPTGCEELAKIVTNDSYKIKVHAFGHIHESRGMNYTSGRYHVNASISDRFVKKVTDPFDVDFKLL